MIKMKLVDINCVLSTLHGDIIRTTIVKYMVVYVLFRNGERQESRVVLFVSTFIDVFFNGSFCFLQNE